MSMVYKYTASRPCGQADIAGKAASLEIGVQWRRHMGGKRVRTWMTPSQHIAPSVADL